MDPKIISAPAPFLHITLTLGYDQTPRNLYYSIHIDPGQVCKRRAIYRSDICIAGKTHENQICLLFYTRTASAIRLSFGG
ncbi:hypothetical protein Q31b_24760 [Novipirellula aureliae]|uniref:Uncharacterized protein n=1 Tax=Novipirellula aureliae TaxID=2527966 RepID=A0A5C6E7I5_9BACT|nr:hypothetical protein Q31b_24760 [Novipirellula aureliae]